MATANKLTVYMRESGLDERVIMNPQTSMEKT